MKAKSAQEAADRLMYPSKYRNERHEEKLRGEKSRDWGKPKSSQLNIKMS